MIASLVFPSTTLPHCATPWSSGPRCRCASFIRTTTSRAPSPKIPAMIHFSPHHPLRNKDPPTVISGSHTQHIRRRILTRQLSPVFETNKINPLFHGRKLLPQ